MRVGLECGALVDCLDFRDDAVGLHLALPGHLGGDDYQVVELQVLVVLEDNAELTRRSVLGAKHAPDPLFVLHQRPSSAWGKPIMALTLARPSSQPVEPGR